MNTRNEIWVVDDDRSIRWVLEKALQQADMHVRGFESGKGVIERLERECPDAILTDVQMPDVNGFELLEAIVARHPNLPVIIMTAYSDLDSTVSAFQGGAFEYMTKPFDLDEAVSLVRRALNQRNEHALLTADADMLNLDKEMIGSAPSMQEVFRAIGRLSRSNITVLLNGESGTGKELAARALHRHSPRAQGPFIALNTAAIPRDLLESELFGHERGAFTGAHAQRNGRFEQAHRGTLFLDEIGDMPADLQTRLLRVLSDGEFFRVGGHVPIRVDVRIIAATHQDLEKRVAQGAFRDDLFHRLNVIRIHMPALRERREDIPELLKHFLGAAAEELGVERKILRAEVQQYLTTLDWPGNVRQLENTCRWLTVMASGTEILMQDLPVELRNPADQNESAQDAADSWELLLRRWAEQSLAGGRGRLLDDALPRFEQIMIEAALRHSGGHRQDAARLLGWGRNTLTRKIKEHGMFAD